MSYYKMAAKVHKIIQLLYENCKKSPFSYFFSQFLLVIRKKILILQQKYEGPIWLN